MAARGLTVAEHKAGQGQLPFGNDEEGMG